MHNLTSEMAAAIAAPVIRPCLLFSAEFADGILRLWTGARDVVWNGQTWYGAGTLLGVSGLVENGNIEANGWSVSLSGVPESLVERCLAQVVQGKIGYLYLGLCNEAGQLINSPALLAAGGIDQPTDDGAPDRCTITITFESRFIDLRRAREWRYTTESQAVDYPGDRAFDYVTKIQRADLPWGRA